MKKTLVFRDPISTADPFDLAALKSHLRIDGDHDDAALGIIGRAAAAEIEHFAQIALLDQAIRVTIFDPDQESGTSLPVGPVWGSDFIDVAFDGEPFQDFHFTAGTRPYVHWQGAFEQLRPSRVTIEYVAGFGDDASSIPSDLAQAIMDQAGVHYDGRSPMPARHASTSPHMARIAARYRGVRA